MKGNLLLFLMRIAVNAILLQKASLDGINHYAGGIFSRLVTQHPEHTFIFMFDRPFDDKFITAPNIIPVIVGPHAHTAFSSWLWYNVTAPLALRKQKPDVWLQPYGRLSLSSSIPQLLVQPALSFIHHPRLMPRFRRWFYQWNTPRFLKKAAGVVTLSAYTRTDIITQYPPVHPNKISVIPGAARNLFRPLSWEEKEQVKDGFADGREYFLLIDDIHPGSNGMNLLRAFSLFKKWQHSNMKLLVIAGTQGRQDKELAGKLTTYKYREDVVLMNELGDEQLAKVMASAYAVICPALFESFGQLALEAMQCGVPVIAGNNPSLPETCGEAALYADPADPESMAKQMMVLYRDENLRTRLIEEGKRQAASFSWERTVEKCWNLLSSLAKKREE